MSAVDDIRVVTADKPQYDRATAVGDGASVDYELPNAPVTTGSAKVYKNAALQTLTTHYTVDEAVGVITWFTAPAINDALTFTYKHSILSDADLTTFLTLSGDSTLTAAAMALDTIASSEALVQKAITVLGLSTNGPAVAAALRAHAKTLREEASVTDDPGFAIIELVHEPFGWQERLSKEWQREGA